MWTHTKIICTIGPATNTYDRIVALMKAGMNVARLNFSHGTHEEHLQVIEHLKKARAMLKMPLAIMLDTKGPEIRIGILPKGELVVRAGSLLRLVREKTEDADTLPIVPGLALDCLEMGTKVLIDDGYITTEVVKIEKESIHVRVENEGVIKNNKGVNIPHADIPLPAMTERDIQDIVFGAKNDVDLIAASFIRSAEHVQEIKDLLKKEGKSDIQVIAKIESSQGVKNFDSIVQVADGIMIARGDLGVELPIEEVPVLQKMMIQKSVQASKPVITATQMLESMIKNPRPTRAEASDVANAVYDGTSCIMLSGETAVGAYPIETVELMKRIVVQAEKNFDYRAFFYRVSRADSHDISTSISLASVKTAYSTGAKAIIALTSSGNTARSISRFRPEIPIVALTSSMKTFHQLAFSWGVIPVDPIETSNHQEGLEAASCFARQRGIVQYGDLIVLTAGTPFGAPGTTNMMIVESVGDVLVRGHGGSGEKLEAKVSIVLSPEKWESKPGHIVVLSKYEESYRPILEQAAGVILQNAPEDLVSEEAAVNAAKELGIPILIRADGAFRILNEDQTVILNPQKGIVYQPR
jgi:pyruvate kinase